MQTHKVIRWEAAVSCTFVWAWPDPSLISICYVLCVTDGGKTALSLVGLQYVAHVVFLSPRSHIQTLYTYKHFPSPTVVPCVIHPVIRAASMQESHFTSLLPVGIMVWGLWHDTFALWFTDTSNIALLVWWINMQLLVWRINMQLRCYSCWHNCGFEGKINIWYIFTLSPAAQISQMRRQNFPMGRNNSKNKKIKKINTYSAKCKLLIVFSNSSFCNFI